MVTPFSNKITKSQKVKNDFFHLSFYVQNSLFLRSVHGTLIIILIMDPSFSLDDSNLNGRTPLQQNLKVLNL